MAMFNGMDAMNNVVGNTQHSDGDVGFKSEVKGVFESYKAQGFTIGNEAQKLQDERVWYDKNAPAWGAGPSLRRVLSFDFLRRCTFILR